jgi:hypothetical protein
MESIDTSATSVGSAPEQVAGALQWLHALPAPRDFAIGTMGGGRLRHKLFKDYTAPLSFFLSFFLFCWGGTEGFMP